MLAARRETGDLTPEDAQLLRLLTPIMKLTTGKQAVMVASEILECFGGAGYIEDTGLPVLLRDCQVLPIWEGTTNVLALDTLRALGSDDAVIDCLLTEIARLLPHADLHEFDESSHMPFWEQPDEHYEIVDEFLHSVVE
jgi:acyl-CoA dehydrogenase